MLHSVVVMH